MYKIHFIEILITFCLIFTIITCHKNLTSVEEEVKDKEEIISIQVGNKYYFIASIMEGIYYKDWFYTRTIEKDTIINGFNYYKYIDNSYVRIDGKRVLKYKNGNDIIKFDYTVRIGVTITYDDCILL